MPTPVSLSPPEDVSHAHVLSHAQLEAPSHALVAPSHAAVLSHGQPAPAHGQSAPAHGQPAPALPSAVHEQQPAHL